MPRLPRLALGSLEPGVNARPLLWGLVEVLVRRARQEVRCFLSRAHFLPTDPTSLLTGRGSRFLDSWLMSPEVCRETFLYGLSPEHLALVVGDWHAPATEVGVEAPAGGSLAELADWLDLPRIGVLDVCRLSACRLPERPSVEALLLVGLSSTADAARWQTQLESLWGVPVLGALALDEGPRAAIAGLGFWQSPSAELCQALGRALEANLDLGRLLALAGRREFPSVKAQLFRPDATPAARRRVAVAYDEAFHCYFPATLEKLELAGAEVVDFSPLHDERLPADVGLVYLGCGHPEWHAPALSRNHLMHAALRSHLVAGGRMYAEAGGLAYLCRQLTDEAGQDWPMVDIWPLEARPVEPRQLPTPVEAELTAACWLGSPGTRIRGYANPRWEFAALTSERLATLTPGGELWCQRRAIGSRLHLHFAGQPGLFEPLVAPLGAAAESISARR